MPPSRLRRLAAAALLLATPPGSALALSANTDKEPHAPGALTRAALWVGESLPGNLVAGALVLGAASLAFAVLAGPHGRGRGWTAAVLAGCVVLFGALLLLAGVEAAAG